MTALRPPPLPYPDFPLRPHKNGQWYKSVWNSRGKKSEQFYFGSWADEPKGERALSDPDTGWLARRDAIRAGIDKPTRANVDNVVDALKGVTFLPAGSGPRWLGPDAAGLPDPGQIVVARNGLVRLDPAGSPTLGRPPTQAQVSLERIDAEQRA
jgi:hypothetical protein